MQDEPLRSRVFGGRFGETQPNTDPTISGPIAFKYPMHRSLLIKHVLAVLRSHIVAWALPVMSLRPPPLPCTAEVHSVLAGNRNRRRYAGDCQLNLPNTWGSSVGRCRHIAGGFECFPKHNDSRSRPSSLLRQTMSSRGPLMLKAALQRFADHCVLEGRRNQWR